MPRDVDNVLILAGSGADERKVLAAVRAIANGGLKVSLGSPNRKIVARRSRFCHQYIELPDPAASHADFMASVSRCVTDDKFEVLLPLCDYTTQALVRDQAQLSRLCLLCVPPAEGFAIACDKKSTLNMADRLGIGVPVGFQIDSNTTVHDVARIISYPCVLKLRRGAGGVGRSFVNSPDQLISTFNSLPGGSDSVFDYEQPLVQEFVPGEIHDACAIFSQGRPLAVVTQKRLAMYPHQGGLGIYNETTRDPELSEQAIRLLKALNWHGPAQVEFKRDTRDGRLKLMEINPRFWGTLDLSIQAGVNFPLLAIMIAADKKPEPMESYPIGMRLRWLFSYRSPTRPVSNFAPLAVADFLRQRSMDRTDLQWNDLLPHAYAALLSTSGYFKAPRLTRN